jgi:hypothetical protein
MTYFADVLSSVKRTYCWATPEEKHYAPRVRERQEQAAE